jgi:hypothetical protein
MALLIFNVRPYLIVNTTANTFQLYKGTELVREGKCSTGSYVKLQGKDREWMFKTPKGYQTIKGRTVDLYGKSLTGQIIFIKYLSSPLQLFWWPCW